ncbi:unnamed protein product [Prunus armeniaca]
MTKSIGEGNESLNKPGSKGSGPVHVFTTKGFRKNSVLVYLHNKMMTTDNFRQAKASTSVSVKNQTDLDVGFIT